MDDADDTSRAIVPASPVAAPADIENVVAVPTDLPDAVIDMAPDAASDAPPAQPGARRALLFAVVGGAAVALAYALAPASESDDADLTAQRGGHATAPRAKAVKPIALTAPQREPITERPAADPFTQVSFVPPPPPPPPAPPPPPPLPPVVPKAPPLPFSFVGLLEKGGPKPTAFLARGDALLIVAAGDVIDSSYRIESLSEREIVVTYLPLNERQSLAATGGRQ